MKSSLNQFLYSQSLSYQGYLIIPFVLNFISGETIYSYGLLSDGGNKNQWHQAINPGKLYSSQISNIIEIAQEYIDKNSGNFSQIDYFKDRYTYQNNLIIIHQENGKCFYDHYPPFELRNIAAPKIFNNPSECINWIKEGFNRKKV